MILKYPLVILLFIPLFFIFYFFKNIKSLHTIRFPKASWLKPLASKKSQKILKLHQQLEFLILSLIIIAIAQPQWIQSKKFQEKKGIDIVTVLDTSVSICRGL